MEKITLLISSLLWACTMQGNPNNSTHSKQQKYVAGPVDLTLTEKDGSIFAEGKSAFSVDGSFVWCGSAIQADEDCKYYLFYSVFGSGKENPAFADAWILGSKLGVAVSDSPYGGYKDLGVFYNKDGYRSDQSSWDAQYAHNPHIKKFGGKYYLYYVGSADPGEQIPVKGKVTRRDRIQQSQTIGVICFNSVKELLEGKFACNEQPLLTPRSRVNPNNVVNPSPAGTPMKPDNLIMVNPAVEYRPKDGKYLLFFKGNVYDPTWRGVHGVAIADRPTGPFEVSDDYVFEFPTENGVKLNAEDPYVWYHRKDRCFYAVFKDFTGSFTKGEPGLAMMSSEDGIHWNLPEESLFMKKELILKDGRYIDVDRLECPQLIFDKNGDPIVLYSACSISLLNAKKDGSSFNVQILIKKRK